MAEAPTPSKLTAEVEGFAGQLMRTLGSVLGTEVGVSVRVGEVAGNVRHVSITQLEPTGIPLFIDRRLVFRLLVSYRCEWNEAQEYFAVAQSNFTVMFQGRAEPFLHFDYLRSGGASIPAAHVNIHAHRDEAIFAMMLASKKRGKERAKRTEEGKVPRVADLHVPMGGHRFRPSLEDVLEMLLLEFGIDVSPGAHAALEAGRHDFRVKQLRAAVTDDLEAAAAVLRSRGYTVESPDPKPSPRVDRLTRY